MKNPTIVIRMGAAEWSLCLPALGHKVDMRVLSKEQQRRHIFEVVKFCREAGLVVT